MLLYTTIDRWYLNHNSAEIVDLYLWFFTRIVCLGIILPFF